MSRQPLSIIACVLGLLLVGTVCGWTQPAGQLPFSRMGTLHNLSGETVIIEDARYALSNTVRVYAYDPSVTDPQKARESAPVQSRNALREGSAVGYTVEGESGGKQGLITEVWLLPAGSLRTLQSKD